VPDRRTASPATDWGAFPDTVLRFATTPTVIIDLRSELTEEIRIALRFVGFERSFGIVTAQDPMGVSQRDDVNARLAASLQEEARKLGATQLLVDACGAGSAHCESSIAIALDMQSVIRLADRYQQLAIFWFDGEAFWIIPVRSSKQKLKLPATV
jgi:hypothetical protein